MNGRERVKRRVGWANAPAEASIGAESSQRVCPRVRHLPSCAAAVTRGQNRRHVRRMSCVREAILPTVQVCYSSGSAANDTEIVVSDGGGNGSGRVTGEKAVLFDRQYV